MALEIPVVLQPLSLAKKTVSYRGQLRLALFKRFLETAEPAEEFVQVELRFFQHVAGFAAVEGNFTCSARYTCERCLSAVSVPIQGAFQVAFLGERQDESCLPEDWDSLELGEDASIRTVDLLEDELILAQPMLPKHAAGECDPALEKYFVPTDEVDAMADTNNEQRKPNPFAALKDLSIKPSQSEE